MRKIAVRVIYMEIFRKDAVLKVGELPACKHAAGVHGIARLRFQRIPVRGDGGYQNTVTGLKIFNQFTGLNDLRAALMT